MADGVFSLGFSLKAFTLLMKVVPHTPQVPRLMAASNFLTAHRLPKLRKLTISEVTTVECQSKTS